MDMIDSSLRLIRYVQEERTTPHFTPKLHPQPKKNEYHVLQEEPQTPYQRGHPPQHRNRRHQRADARVVVLDDPLLENRVVYVGEAELGRVEAVGVVEGRDALVAVFYELDVDALVTPVSIPTLFSFPTGVLSR